MPNLTIEMTEAQLFALDTIAIDKQEWADNVLTHRAWAAVQDMKGTDVWSAAIAAVATAGGDITDDWAVLMAGRDAGIIKTLAQIEAEKPPVITPPPPPVVDPPSPGTYDLPKQVIWQRATDQEADALMAVLNALPVRMRMIYDGAAWLNSGSEFFPQLVAAIGQALGEQRALELTAPVE